MIQKIFNLVLVLKTALVWLDHLDKYYNPLDLQLYGQMLAVAVEAVVASRMPAIEVDGATVAVGVAL